MIEKPKLNFPGPDPLTDDMPEEMRRVVDVTDRITSELAMNVAQDVDNEITKAIQMRLGLDWKPIQLTGRLGRTIYMDGSEVMVLDGVPILHIGPWKIWQAGMSVKATRECTHLKGADDVLPN
jgi:hypothetical protein